MADLLAVHLDIDAVTGLLHNGPPPRPILKTSLRERAETPRA
jgi:hypothetical protein